MNSKYTGKQIEDLLDKISISGPGGSGGTSVEEINKILDKCLRKDQSDRSPYSIASDEKIEVGEFRSGSSGAIIYVDKATGKTIAELDKLYIRMKAYFEQLEIIKSNIVGGKQIISPAGGIKCSKVETYPSWGYYRCFFLAAQEGEQIDNLFTIGDQAYSKTFNAKEGVYNQISNKYYWRLVVGVGEDYIDLSKSDCDADSDEPSVGDIICHRGNRNDIDRQNFIEFSSVDSFSPSITLYQQVNNYSLVDKAVIQFGVEKSTGKAFMNIYGDYYIGNRDKSSYISYTPETGVKIKGSLDVGTKLGDKTLQESIEQASNSYKEPLDTLKQSINEELKNVQKQIDGVIETWFYEPIPTLTNLPASLWTTNNEKEVHLGDLYYSGSGRAYRFQYDSDTSNYYWNEIVDTDILLALENAKKAQDTADSKRKTFVRKPENIDSYDIGDIWVNATYSDNTVTYDQDLLRAIESKAVGEEFKIEHWTLASKYTDDTVAKDALEKSINAQQTINTLQGDVTNFKNYVDGAFLDGIISTSESQAIEKYINQLVTIKAQVDNSYEEIIKNSVLTSTTYLTNLNNSYTAFSSSYNELINTITEAIEDNIVTDLEKSAVDSKYNTFNNKYKDYVSYLNQAINYIEETINNKADKALQDIGGYSYLKKALQENTSITGGLIQSSMLSLGYTNSNGEFLVMAGTNGLVVDRGNKTIASWFGGGMIDMFDYYDSTTKTFNIPNNIRVATGVDRMDGTGYRANGKFWWDESGKLHADPLSFFVGDTNVGGLLAAFQIVMKSDGIHPQYLIPQVPFQSLEIADYIRIGDALLKYDSTNKAIYVTSVDGNSTIGFYSEGWVSAKGANLSSGGGSASALYQLVDVLANSTNDGVQGATTNSVLMYNGTKWYAGTINVGLDEVELKAYLDTNKYTTTTYVDNKISTINSQISNINNQVSTISNQVSSINSQISTINSQLDTKADKTALDAYLPLSGGTITGDLTVNDTIYVGTTNYVYHTGNLAGDNAWTTLSSNVISHKTIHANNITLIASSGQFVTGYTVDKAGHIVSISQKALNASDIPSIAIAQVTGLQDALDKKVDSIFFARVFGLLDADGNEIAVNDVTTIADSIKAKFGLWTEQYISAKGKSSSSSGSGGGTSALYQLVDVVPNSTNDGVFNAVKGSVLTYNGTKWQAGTIHVPTNLSEFTNDSGFITSAAIPTKLSAFTNDSGFITSAAIPTSLKNPYALKFGSQSYDGSSAKTITASDLGALTSHQSIYQLTIKANDATVLTFTPNSAAGSIAFVAGSNISLSADATNKKITIANTYSYTHPSGGANVTIAAAVGKVLGAITVNSLGHVTSVSAKTLVAADVTDLADVLGDYATITYVNDELAYTNETVSALVEKVNNFLEGTDTDGIINKWKELEAFLAGQTQTSTLADLLNVKAFASTKIIAGTGLTGGGDLTADRTLSLAASGVTAGTYPKVTVDQYGRVTAGSSLLVDDIPNLPWSKITSGKPTTLTGYGITDGVNSVKVGGSGNAVTAASVSGHVLTLTKGVTFLPQSSFDDLFEKVLLEDGKTYAIRAKYGFYSDSFVSAKGLNPSSSGGGSGASALYQLLDVVPNSTGTGVLNAVSGAVLMYNGSKWQAGIISVPNALSQLTNDA